MLYCLEKSSKATKTVGVITILTFWQFENKLSALEK